MKGKIFIGILGLLTLIGVSAFAVVKAPGDSSEALVSEEGFPGSKWCDGKGHNQGRKLEIMAEVLDLTDEQKTQVREIIAAEWETTKPLRATLREKRRELRAAMQSGTFDEAAIRSIAASQADTFTELIVAKARGTSKVFAVLTPEQQAKAEKIRPLLKGRRGGHHRGFRGLLH
jgi:Spy/CpxP family protein refolding chaperone